MTERQKYVDVKWHLSRIGGTPDKPLTGDYTGTIRIPIPDFVWQEKPEPVVEAEVVTEGEPKP